MIIIIGVQFCSRNQSPYSCSIGKKIAYGFTAIENNAGNIADSGTISDRLSSLSHNSRIGNGLLMVHKPRHIHHKADVGITCMKNSGFQTFFPVMIRLRLQRVFPAPYLKNKPVNQFFPQQGIQQSGIFTIRRHFRLQAAFFQCSDKFQKTFVLPQRSRGNPQTSRPSMAKVIGLNVSQQTISLHEPGKTNAGILNNDIPILHDREKYSLCITMNRSPMFTIKHLEGRTPLDSFYVIFLIRYTVFRQICFDNPASNASCG